MQGWIETMPTSQAPKHLFDLKPKTGSIWRIFCGVLTYILPLDLGLTRGVIYIFAIG